MLCWVKCYAWTSGHIAHGSQQRERESVCVVCLCAKFSVVPHVWVACVQMCRVLPATRPQTRPQKINDNNDDNIATRRRVHANCAHTWSVCVQRTHARTQALLRSGPVERPPPTSRMNVLSCVVCGNVSCCRCCWALSFGWRWAANRIYVYDQHHRQWCNNSTQSKTRLRRHPRRQQIRHNSNTHKCANTQTSLRARATINKIHTTAPHARDTPESGSFGGCVRISFGDARS